ncbi:Glu-tRNA(Gln) amidotransferase subunit GatE [Candidatus Woesearchaeota archaeon]|nr:Glu-tRNA(Gln) amidotransferase subunit GatE [Candidatus Woesearchaeota archaeon]
MSGKKNNSNKDEKKLNAENRSELDYPKLGLKCGIEIHQQVDTNKLFCSCSSDLREETPDYTITRRLRSVIGETGEIDIAALQEHRKEKKYIYEGYNDSTCLVETDEEPPHKINKDALYVGLQVALLMKANIVDKIQVMRKTVVDGSNTSGFQRTSLLAMNGAIDTSFGKVGIPSICLEEDSSRPITQDSASVTYRLDRLGIPLVEIATDPAITHPDQVREVAEFIGMVLRSTGKVKRGLGTIRQDVNVSIAEGRRVEIKGAQELKMLATLVEYEALRQKNLVEIKKELLSRIKQMRELSNEKISVTETFNNVESNVIKNALKDKKGAVLALKLPKFAGLIAREIQPGRRLGTEFSDRAKVIAGVGGIFHSDELPKYGIEQEHVDRVREILGCKEQDAFILVADNGKKAELALDAVFERAMQALNGIPGEVRRANEDGTTTYMRPMPGAARLYPETDAVPISLDEKFVAEIKLKLPELLLDKSDRFEDKHKLGHDLAVAITKSSKHELFERFVERFENLKPAYLAETLLTAEKQVKKQFMKEVVLKDADFEELFIYLNAGKIAKEVMLEILSKTNEKPLQDVIVEYELMSDAELEKEVKQIVSENKGQPFNVIIGKVMSQLRGKADGKKIVENVKRFAK